CWRLISAVVPQCWPDDVPLLDFEPSVQRVGTSMSQAVIISFTLIDFPNENEMRGFLHLVEQRYEAHAAKLRAAGMTRFYVTRIFNKSDKFTIGNWLEYRDQDAFAKCDAIWKEYMSDLIKDVPQFAPKISPNRGIVMYDFSDAEEE
ncbi:MAG TPA: hypothetical protein DD668_05795, partial [Alphaproteobacteria bacterium]|nr:hypothetical protein [Alphaproteobacteria bacterium]